NIDEVIQTIRTSPDPATARERLMSRDWPAQDVEPLLALIADPRHVLTEAGTLRLSEEQARAILDLRLQRLTALGRDEIGDELKALGERIGELLEILQSRIRLLEVVRDELHAVREAFATDRRTQIVDAEQDLDDEDLIQREDMVVTVTHGGYIKRVPLSEYRTQRRGGRGRSGMATREEDFVARVFVVNTHTPVLFFSSTGMAYTLKVWRLPQATPQSRGKALVNLLPLAQDEKISTILPLPEDEASWGDLHVMFATATGNVRRNSLSDFANVMANGKIAMKLPEGDRIVGVSLCTDDQDVLLTTSRGKSIRFNVTDVRVFKGRESTGVRGIRLSGGDAVISMAMLRQTEVTPGEARAYLKQAAQIRRSVTGDGEEADLEIAEEVNGEEAETALEPSRYAELGAYEEFVLSITEHGFGKRTSSFEYRRSGRGGQGINAMSMSDRNGPLVASFPVEETDEVMVVTDSGVLIRCPVNEIRIAARATQGVRIIRTDEDAKVMSVDRLSDMGQNGEGAEDAEDEGGEAGGAGGAGEA
ncbi:MAG: DNA gyrase C-terminal beta-propeller domain-containing protein, partial [Pseudomonadota bacterium]